MKNIWEDIIPTGAIWQHPDESKEEFFQRLRETFDVPNTGDTENEKMEN